MARIRIGEVLRYARPYRSDRPVIDKLRNYFHITQCEGMPMCLLEHGINPIAMPQGRDFAPAILIASSPHKVGSHETPWQDLFAVDRGHIHYYGDNKKAAVAAGDALGNKVLLRQFSMHTALERDKRKNAAPIVCFQRVKHGKAVKGYLEFQGFGVVERVELITQYNRKTGEYFTNYAFDFAVFQLQDEAEEFDWEWICARRTSIDPDDALPLAPKAWRQFIEKGPMSIERNRRRVAKLMTMPRDEQKPLKNSAEEKVLHTVVKWYGTRRARFEALAALITGRVLGTSGGAYKFGWITPPSADGGADFVARFDVGTGFSTTKLVVFGQAKCESVNAPTGGQHIARTVARLKRGWIGVYVTTSYFSESVQREVIEDQYPIVLIHGRRLAEELVMELHEKNYSDLSELLAEVDASYETRIQFRQPEEILI